MTTKQLYDNRITVSGDTRITVSGDTRVVYGDTITTVELIAIKRDYNLTTTKKSTSLTARKRDYNLTAETNK